MRAFKFGLLIVMAMAVSACSSSKFKTYKGPEITQVYVAKERRKMYLLHGEDVVKTYEIDLGFEPTGDKKERGDGKTPEGFYLINRRNPNSSFHLSLGISYPNSRDIAEAKAAGVDPGGDIFIHGQPNLLGGGDGEDWTAGCIAVTNGEIEEIYAMVTNGTPIYIAN